MTGQTTRESSIVALDKCEHIAELQREIDSRLVKAMGVALAGGSIVAEIHDLTSAIIDWRDEVKRA